MSFALYPDPPLRALSVPPAATVFTPFVGRSARVPELDPPYAQAMFLRVAMLGGTAAPGLLVAAGAGDPVEVSVDPQGVFRSPGEVGYVGDVSLNPVGPNVFEILVGLVSVDPALGWRLGIRNTDAADRFFTWVVADNQADTVHPWVDPGPANYRVTATIPVGGVPSHIALDPANQTAYITNITDNSVAVIDLSGRAVVATIPVGQRPAKVAVDTQTHAVYAASSTDSTISVIDAAGSAVTTTIPDAPQAGALAVDPVRRTLYVGTGSFSAGAIMMIDTDTHAVIGTVPVGHRPFDLAIDPTSHTLYATDFQANAVLVLDPESRSVTPINVNKRTFGATVDPVSRAVYVSCHDNTLIMIDPGTQALTTIPAGQRPTFLAVDPVMYTLYVANRGEDTVSAIDTRTGALKGVRVGRPQSVAIDPVTHTAISPADTAAAYLAVIERSR